nr:cysteine dioxygenase-like isoform X1 [Procambarus clarkii]
MRGIPPSDQRVISAVHPAVNSITYTRVHRRFICNTWTGFSSGPPDLLWVQLNSNTFTISWCKGYTRNLIDEGNGKFNLMLLCWGPSHTSTIHDHANAHCFMKMMSGSLQEVRFEWPQEAAEEQKEQEMVETDRNVLKINDVVYINDSLGLHRVENTSHSEGAVSLHLYCPPFSSCSIFDERTGKKMKCPVTFWSKYGQKVEQKKSKTGC